MLPNDSCRAVDSRGLMATYFGMYSILMAPELMTEVLSLAPVNDPPKPSTPWLAATTATTRAVVKDFIFDELCDDDNRCNGNNQSSR